MTTTSSIWPNKRAACAFLHGLWIGPSADCRRSNAHRVALSVLSSSATCHPKTLAVSANSRSTQCHSNPLGADEFLSVVCTFLSGSSRALAYAMRYTLLSRLRLNLAATIGWRKVVVRLGPVRRILRVRYLHVTINRWVARIRWRHVQRCPRRRMPYSRVRNLIGLWSNCCIGMERWRFGYLSPRP